MKIAISILLGIGYLLLFPRLAFSQTYSAQIYNYDDGLEASRLQSLKVLQDGRIAISSDQGLILFSGQAFEVFGVKQGLNSSSVTHTHQLPTGNLLVSTVKGVYFFDGIKFLDTGWCKQFANTLVNLAIFKNGVYYISASTGLFKASQNKLMKITIPAEFEQEDILDMFCDNNGNLYCHAGTGDFVLTKNGIKSLPFSSSIYKYNLEGTLFYSDYKKIYSFANGQLISEVEINTLTPRKPESAATVIMILDKRIYFNDPKGFAFAELDDKLPEIRINDCTRDDNGTIWGWDFQYIYRIYPSFIDFYQFDDKKYLKSYYAGTNLNKGLGMLFPDFRGGFLDNKKNMAYNTSLLNVLKKEVPKGGAFWNIFYLNPEEIWLDHSVQGLLVYKNNALQKLYNSYPNVKRLVYMRYAAFSENKIALIAETGCTILDRKTGNVAWYAFPKKIRPVSVIGNNESLYIGCSDGVYMLSNAKLSLIPLAKFGVGSEIRQLLVKDNKLWCSVQDAGIVCWDLLNNKVIRKINISNGLINNNFNSFFVDEKHNLWILFPNALQFLNLSSKEISTIIFDRKSGMPYQAFEDNMIWEPGEMAYFKLENGIGIFSPDLIYSMQLNSIKNVFFTKLIIGNREIALNNFSKEHIPKLEFQYTKENINILFNSVVSVNSKYVTYQYRIVNESEDWKDLGSKAEIGFINLAPGKYQIEIRAGINHIGWSKTSNLTLVILPPWYQTWWFYLVALFLVSISLFFIIRYIIAFRNKRFVEAQIKAELLQQIAESELVALKSQIEPHFIQNVFAFLAYKVRSGESSENTVLLLKQASQWFKKVLHLSDNQSHTIQEEMEMLKDYIELYRLIFSKHFEFVLQNNLSNELSNRLSIPTMILQPFVENALKHGFSGLDNSAHKLEVIFGIENNLLKCKIQDNGKGFNTDEAVYSKSFEVTQRRLKLATNGRGNIVITSNMGTTIVILLPLL